MFGFDGAMIGGGKVKGVALDGADLERLAVGEALLVPIGDIAVVICLGIADDKGVGVLVKAAHFGELRFDAAAADGVAWTCGHHAGAACAECYRQLAARSAGIQAELADIHETANAHPAPDPVLIEEGRPKLTLFPGPRGRKN